MIPTDLLLFVNPAAGMNDCWLFAANLVVFGGFSAVVMRYFVHQHERLIDDHKRARDTYPESLCGTSVHRHLSVIRPPLPPTPQAPSKKGTEWYGLVRKSHFPCGQTSPTR